jgi:hypothetical protein
MLINDASITGSLIVNASSSFQNIAVSGNILPGTNNVYNLGSVDKYFKEIFVSTGSINFVDNTGIKTTISSVAGGGIQIGSVQITTSSISFVDITGSITQTIAQSSSLGSTSNFTPTSSFNAYTQSFSSSVSTSFSSSLASVTSLSSSVSASITSLSSSVSSSVTSLSSSLTSVNTAQNTRLTTIESVTGSYETKGRGIVSGSSQITYTNISSIPSGIVSGSTQITPLLPTNVVSGSSQITYVNISSIPSGIVSSSAQLENANITNLTITNLTTVNQTASVLFTSGSNRFGDFGDDTHSFTGSVKISGSFTLVGASTATSYNGTINATNGVVSGSSQVDGTAITNKSITIAGTSTALGGTITLATMTGGSAIHSGSYLATATTANLSENTNLYYTDARVKTKLDAETVVSGSKTISGITLGSNLATLTISTGLSGTSYNGSTGVTISNSGVTSIVAGTGISINQGTAAVTVTNSGVTSIVAGTGISINQGTSAVTVTNSITNNNQLTNGAGYITSAGTSADSNLLNSISAVNLYNNMGASHGTRTSFDASSPSYGFGYRYVQGLTNGPGTGGGAPGQFYSWYIGLGTDYPATGAGSYGAMFAIDRNSTSPYLSVRYNENNSFSSWKKVNAGLADGITGALAITGAITATGDITAYYSDGRLKENLKIISNPIEKIRKITGYTYNTNELGKVLLDNENDNDNKVGLIAQDLQKVLPEAVKLAPFDRDENGNSKSGENYLTIQYEKVVPLLVEAIKEQQIKIDNLTIEVENLKKPKGL